MLTRRRRPRPQRRHWPELRRLHDRQPLLAHSDLFRAGIARSGAYNRTLTPYGFQAEERTYWKAPRHLLKMSPFNYADKIKTPILLIHGEADDNQGTFPVQSERFYEALKGQGATVRLVWLPLEAHGYEAKESLEHMLWEQSRWLDTYIKPTPPRPPPKPPRNNGFRRKIDNWRVSQLTHRRSTNNMTPRLEKPSISAGGLVTVAFLKAQLDSGGDHLSIFFPLVLDSARSFQHASFAKSDVQERLYELHGVSMPQHVIGTLLDRAIGKGLVSREAGRYKSKAAIETILRIADATREINDSQMRLANRLIEHASKRGLEIATAEAPLETLLSFLETEQVDLLLEGTTGHGRPDDSGYREKIIVAEFIHDIVAEDEAFSTV